MIRISIAEIENGFMVELFDSNGPVELDKTVFCKTFKEVLEKIIEWKTQEEKEAKPDE